MDAYLQLRRKFQSLGCDVDTPGFCNSAPFLRAERSNPTILEEYARYISLREPSDPERSKARILHAARFIHAALVRSGRQGACVDVSCVLSEFLNRRGEWSYVVKGGASVLPVASGIQPVRMQPITGPSNPAVAGHAWLVAPPFKVLDLSIGLQPYPPAIRAAVPADQFLAASETRPGRPVVEDFIDGEAMRPISRQLGRVPTLADVYDRINPGLRERVEELGVHEVEFGQTVVRYVSCAIGGMEDPLEQWRNIRLDGLWPAPLYEAYVRTADLPE